jgi:DNA-binding CsgD family transcriptional regulator/PAS domain-containing protein
MSCESDILPIISKIYDSILDPGCCAEIGEALVRLAGGHIGVLVTHSGARSNFFPDMAYNVDVKARDAYLAHYDRISPFHSLERLSRPGQIITASHLVTSTDYKKSAFYNEFARKRDHWDYLGIMLSKDAAAMTGFAILRPHQAGLVTPLEIERMKAIAPHLQRAFMIKNRLNESRTQVSVLESAIDGTGFGVVIATATGWIAYANRAAENLLRGGRGLRCERGRISATDSPTAHKLQALIAAASRVTEDAAPGGSLLVPDESGTVSLAIHVVPFSPGSSDILFAREQPFAGVFIVDRNSEINDRAKQFASLFRLTPGEARVLAEVISGEGIAKVSERLKITELTARTHLKHIAAKTDTHRQAELVKLFFETTIPGAEYIRRPTILGWRDAQNP